MIVFCVLLLYIKDTVVLKAISQCNIKSDKKFFLKLHTNETELLAWVYLFIIASLE